jgi:putative ABC transport system permease protein
MLQNYFTMAWRSLLKNKGFSIINILGLSVGIAFTLLMGAYVWGELQVNRQLKNADNQYIIQSKWKDPNLGFELGTIAELPKALKTLYPTLVSNCYHLDAVTSNVSKGDKHFRESIVIGDSTLLSMYGFALLHGSPQTALTDPFSAVITQQLAIKYFGSTNVVGQTLTIESFSGSKHPFTVSGVLNGTGINSISNVNGSVTDIYLPEKAAVFLGRNLSGWNNTNIVGFIELKPGVNPKQLDGSMRHLVKQNAPQQIADNLTPYLVPLKTYYREANGGTVNKLIYTLSFIAFFILMMAVVNFINICIGRSSSRMKEMGIRKVLGGLRKQLIWQFLIESVLLVLLATLVALAFYAAGRPYLSDVLGKQIVGLFSFPVYFYAIPLVFAVLVGLLAGIYPALVLSALKSVDSLKGKLASIKESVLFRKTLVAFQFGTAALVFISAIIISQQVDLFFSKDLGFKKDFVVYAQLPRDWSVKGVQKMEAYRYELAQLPEVSSVSLSWEIPDGGNGGPIQLYRQGTNPAQAVTTQGLSTDNQYAKTYNIQLLTGAFFTPSYTPGDSSKIVINQAAAKALGYKSPGDAVGKQVMPVGGTAPFIIYGVTSDFHFGSMHDAVKPITFLNVNFNPYYRFFSIKLKPGDAQKSIEALQHKWSALMPDAPFEYHFVDDALAKLYQTEIQLKKASYVAGLLAIIIVLLGVVGLISLSIQKRTREIGIRKVLGASVPGIINLFLKEFLGVVLIACVISCPLAWLIMHNWLNGYAYRIDITGYPFLISILLLTILTVVVITLQTIKAAVSNPVKSLRME